MFQGVSISIPSVEHPVRVPPLPPSSSISITQSPDADPLVTVGDSGSSLCLNLPHSVQDSCVSEDLKCM